MSQIIDFELKGNCVRFYTGNAKEEYWGDDWDDRPYEHNAGAVYGQYTDGYVDVVFPFDAIVLEPQDDWSYNGNSPYSKADMQNRCVPCIAALLPEDIPEDRYWDYDGFGR